MKASLIEFSVENFKAFRDKACFSMVAPKNDGHTFQIGGENLLKTSFIYGPNASGKTSLLDGFRTMQLAILLSANLQEDSSENALEKWYEPFLGAKEANKSPTSFEVTFSVNEKKEEIYKYTFSFLKKSCVHEELKKIASNKRNDEILFSRKNQKIKISDRFGADASLIGKTREESLFLSVATLFNNETAKMITDSIFRSMNCISALNSESFSRFTHKKFHEDLEYKKRILEYLKAADFCISSGKSEEAPLTKGRDLNSFRSRITHLISFKHPIFSGKKEVGAFELAMDKESKGTQKFINLLGPILDTLDEGKVLFIDEFDNSLHPILTKFVVDLFESEETNKKNAQLIVTTHDTSLLAYKDDFIKDQFWFTEKDEFGATKLFSLAEFNVRNDTEYAKKYLEGRFGALPFIKFI